MSFISTSVSFYKTHSTLVRSAVLVLGVFIIAVIIRSALTTSVVVVAEPVVQTVAVTTAQQYAGGQSVSLIGNVRAFTEAEITAERGGQVVRVNATLGQTVSAGQVIATLENAAESASVLSAEGAYDAAVAGSAQSGVGVAQAQNTLKSAQNDAVSTFKSSYNTTNGVIINSIDTFFSSPESSLIGLRIDGKGYTAALNSERLAYQALLPAWQSKAAAITADSDLVAELQYSQANVTRTITLVDTFLTVFKAQDSSNRYTDAELQTFTTSFTALRATLIATQASLNSALTDLQTAVDGVERAQLAASGGTTSAADAQIKQALGSLRAAQASYAKTILRTPISGTVNSLSLRAGDYIGANTKVAVVANNAALEIITYVGDTERDLLSIGDTVMIENKYEGTIVQIAPAVDATTRKTEVRIAAENMDIANGDTVRITKEFAADEAATVAVSVPLTAVKFEATNGFVFQVTEEGVLTKRSVVLGSIRGSMIEIAEGLAADESFVVDVRGLRVDEKVTISK